MAPLHARIPMCMCYAFVDYFPRAILIAAAVRGVYMCSSGLYCGHERPEHYTCSSSKACMHGVNVTSPSPPQMGIYVGPTRVRGTYSRLGPALSYRAAIGPVPSLRLSCPDIYYGISDKLKGTRSLQRIDTSQLY